MKSTGSRSMFVPTVSTPRSGGLPQERCQHQPEQHRVPVEYQIPDSSSSSCSYTPLGSMASRRGFGGSCCRTRPVVAVAAKPVAVAVGVKPGAAQDKNTERQRLVKCHPTVPVGCPFHPCTTLPVVLSPSSSPSPVAQHARPTCRPCCPNEILLSCCTKGVVGAVTAAA